MYLCVRVCQGCADQTDEFISNSDVSYGNEAVFYSNLYYTVDVTADYQNDTDTIFRDDSSFWYAGVRYGVYDKTGAELVVLNVSGGSTAKVALTAAYWFECGSAREEAGVNDDRSILPSCHK